MVRVANGSPLQCGSRFDDVALQIGDVKFTVTLHVLPLVGLDLVLGVKWLETLGPVICDWKAQTMQIMWKGEAHTLNGLKAAIIKPTSPQEIVKEAYHPQSDGQTEVVNRCIEQFLRFLVQNRPKQWKGLLPWAEYWYNTTYHSSTGMTPFEALYGRQPPLMPRYEVGSSLVEEIDEQLQKRDELLNELKQHLQAANNRMKQLADRKRRDVEFEVGDWVFLRLQPYRQKSVFKRSSQKLASRFFGPFQIEKRIGEVAYRLQLPEGSRIHPVFHVSLLKKRVGDAEPVSVELPPLKANGMFHLEPAEVLKQRRIQRGSKEITEVLIKWENLPLEEATWEDYTQIKDSFPLFVTNLEDKVLGEDGGIDTSISPYVRPKRTPKPNPKYQ